MSYPPSMVHKSGDHLVVRSVVSGNKLFGTSEFEEDTVDDVELTTQDGNHATETTPLNGYQMEQEEELPQCKVKRNYACSSCSYYTQNPRYYLHHLKNVHKEKIRIYECPHCLYASKHSQKLQRHIHMVHVMGKRKMLIKAKTTSTSNKNANVAVKKQTSSQDAFQQRKVDNDTSISNALSDSKEESTLLSSSVSEMEAEEEAAAAEGENQSDQPIKCSLCSFSSRNPNLVTRHERLVHLKKKFYRCTKCDYITHMKARFTKHVKYHSMPMIKCEMCDFRTPYKWNLDRHNKNHFANGAFKCSQCNFTADIKQSLTVHEMNHHVPPVNQNGGGGLAMPTPAKRRCRVGASDIIGQQEAETTSTAETDLDDLELLRMERESLPALSAEDDSMEDSSIVTSDEAAQMAAVEITMVKPNASPGAKSLNIKNPTAAAYLNGTLKPEDVILTKNGSVYVKKFKCRVCQYKAAWESEMIRHEVRVHGLDSAAKKRPPPRPIPNLIPIQNNSSNSGNNSNAASPSHSAASTPTHASSNKVKPNMGRSATSSPLKNGALVPSSLSLTDFEYDKPLTEKDLNEIYTRSCATSSLKDFASLIGTDESSLKSDRFKDFVSMFSEEKEPNDSRKIPEKIVPSPSVEAKPVGDSEPPSEKKKLPDAFKKKNASFFDRLKEKLMVGGGESHNLSCWCGHQSKCLSESVLHQKTHSENVNEKSDKSLNNGPLISNAELSSTRCQHCRQRCKTSSDLFAHLQSCPEMIKKENDCGGYASDQQNDDVDNALVNGGTEIKDERVQPPEQFPEVQEAVKQPNKVFVWNNFVQDKEECSEEFGEDEFRSKSPASESSLVGYEIAPGIGSVMPSNNEEAAESFKEMNIDVHNVETTTKKVFKCPTCTFWASTASRFHVHVVSHMNVKPFGCSVCPYQSKWKWDVTKHIKLKKERDPTHERAEMRTIDVETGRRNYTKYNRFLTVMRVHEPRLDLSASAIKSAVASVSHQIQQPSVPLLPKLTPAPSMNGDADSEGSGNAGASTGDADIMMRPLPRLHPANPSVAVKRPHESATSDDGEAPKKKLPGEKKMWKCKKCKFRNTDRNIVLAHVKEHYTSNSQNANNNRNLAGDNAGGAHGPRTSGENHTSLNGIIRCNLCNFETDNEVTFRIHDSHHVEDPSAAFKCSFCPFFANDKQFMINHISTHGMNNAEEIVSNALHNEDVYRKDEYEDKLESSMDEPGLGEITDASLNKSDSGVGDEMEIYKRFKCCSCPYVTNNKSQYLYHKQFHRLRDAPFKCNICSYNVTKRHLLHQHLKIHGVKRAQFKSCLKAAAEKKSSEEEGMRLNTDVDTAHLPDAPLVWVHKAGTLTKMFKCRHCPHVNLRKSNIHEHEKMHFDRIQRSPNGTITPSQASTHHCTDCNYVCNNAGALASHAKVHQGAFGYICALADPRRSDESQIREITRLLKEEGRFKSEPSKSENTADKQAAPGVDALSPQNNTDASAATDSPAAPNDRTNVSDHKMLHFCNVCPARFLFHKDLESHTRFHSAHHMFKCNSCTYSAPMQAQLMAHKRVHSNEYQEKTNLMCQTYEISKDFSRPKTTHISEKPGFAGLGWVVMASSQKKEETISSGGAKPAKTVTKQFSCHKCPAQFFKSVALQHHLTLHGGKDQYQCRGCDYRVKTYGNLIKHEAVHGLEPRMKAKMLKNKKFNLGEVTPSVNVAFNASIPCSGTELFQHRSEQMLKEQTTPTPIARPCVTPPPIVVPTPPSAVAIAAAGLSADPEFGIFIHGSPDFIYPQTVKNGKLKEKRYKCHKCPSAFEKREQYKTHVSLHGAKSRFRCEKCDYSVKYFANYTQHMRKHEMNEKCISERRASVQSKTGSEESGNEKAVDVMSTIGLMSRPSMSAEDSGAETVHSAVTSPEKSLHCTPLATPSKAAKTLHISVADQQAVVLMQEKISDFGINMADQLHRCYYCPYSHQRRDTVVNHERCHFNPKGSYVCEFCNYTVPQPHFLREHQKLHFGTMKGIKPEAYMKCDRLEIWMETEEGKVLIFKDSGRKENRFEPPVTANEEDSEFKKMYVDVKTGEEFTPCKDEPLCENEIARSPIEDPVFNQPSDVESIESSPARVKDEEELALKNELMKEEMVDVKDEPVEQIDDENESKMEIDEEEYLKMMNDVEDETENVEDEEEELENVENDEDEPLVGDSMQEAAEDFNYASGSEVVEEFEDDAELESNEQVEIGDDDSVDEDLADPNDECENLDEGNMIKEVLDDKEMIGGDDNSTADATKTASDDSDSEDSESSSSSSSSCSGSSCSSSDSSDEDKEQVVDEDNRTIDGVEEEEISEE